MGWGVGERNQNFSGGGRKEDNMNHSHLHAFPLPKPPLPPPSSSYFSASEFGNSGRRRRRRFPILAVASAGEPQLELPLLPFPKEQVTENYPNYYSFPSFFPISISLLLLFSFIQYALHNLTNYDLLKFLNFKGSLEFSVFFF